MSVKITCISDTHGMHKNVVTSGGDVLVFAGDWQGTHYDRAESFVDWLSFQNYSHVVVVLGNHDGNLSQIESLCKRNERIHLLHDSGIEIFGLNFYGTPWTNQFGNWSYMADEEVLKAVFDLIPLDTDVLVSHSPARGIMDSVAFGLNTGSESLSDRIAMCKLKLHVFGHIHEHGGKIIYKNEYLSVNASVLDENYNLVNKPVDVILEELNG